MISGRSPSNQGKSYRMYINLKLFKDVLFLKLKFNNKCYDGIKSIFSLHIVPFIRSYVWNLCLILGTSTCLLIPEQWAKAPFVPDTAVKVFQLRLTENTHSYKSISFYSFWFQALTIPAYILFFFQAIREQCTATYLFWLLLYVVFSLI